MVGVSQKQFAVEVVVAAAVGVAAIGVAPVLAARPASETTADVAVAA